jgi:streptogrisin C
LKEALSRSNCNDSLRAGLVISTGGSCSIGFTARSSNGLTRWVLTAGHCSDGTSTTVWSTGGTAIGPLTSAINSGAVDAAAIQVTNATYRADTAGRIYMHNAAGRSVPVNGAADVMSDISVGDVVCLSANITDPTASSNPCAVIGSVSDANARGLVRVDGYDGCQGDSGGGWYGLASGARIAYGLHSRSNEGCKVANGTSWFSALPQFWTALVYETS